MTDDSVDLLLREIETAPDVRWRLEQLLDAGYPVEEAEAIAGRRDVDLHQAIRLLERGCRPEVAARILL